ncbi:MAG TPA: DUF4384 domain-containing protein [Candidatus Angelobacter sp.]|jgi:hypothetical protein|nr:DUF4384 domain-containing protein [Candidatus Angelobacter sp.]
MNTPAKRFFLYLAIASALCATACAQQTGAQQLYRSSQGQGIRVSIELKRGNIIRRVSPQTTFLTGDRVKIHFSTNFDGYVYALNETPNGDTVLLFPTRETGTANLVQSGRDYVIPATSGWFRFDEETGAETIHMIGSRQRLPDIEKEHQLKAQQSQPAGWPSQPVNNSTSVTSSPYAASSGNLALSQSQSAAPAQSNQTAASPVQKDVATAKNEVGKAQGEFGKATGEVGKVTSQAQRAKNGVGNVQSEVGKIQSGISITKTVTSMPKQLMGIFGARSRDLTFEDDPGEGAAYVSSPSRLSEQPVYFTVELVHQ